MTINGEIFAGLRRQVLGRCQAEFGEGYVALFVGGVEQSTRHHSKLTWSFGNDDRLLVKADRQLEWITQNEGVLEAKIFDSPAGGEVIGTIDYNRTCDAGDKVLLGGSDV